MPDFGPVRGYGDVLWRTLSVTKGEILVFPEVGPVASSLPGLLGPLIEREELALVKGFGSAPDWLSELVARPLVNLYRPELSGFVEPLSTGIAVRRDLLEKLPFPVGDGVTLSLLLDAAEQVGVEALAQTDLEGGQIRTPSLSSTEAAYAIQAAAASRVPLEGQEQLVPGPLFLPTMEGLQTRRTSLEERPPLASLNDPVSVSRIVN